MTMSPNSSRQFDAPVSPSPDAKVSLGLAPYPTDGEALAIVRIARELGGISLDADKKDFIRTRLGRLLREFGLDGYGGLVARATQSQEIRRRVLEALTTHTTSFFRENNHYDWMLETALPEMLGARVESTVPFTVWSAACSTGVELWSAGMTLARFEANFGRTVPYRLIGTDVSEQILKVVRGATYTEEQMSGVPSDMRSRFFLRANAAAVRRQGHVYRVVPVLRAKAEFRVLNLLQANGRTDFKADIAFLRNVLIYFDPPDRDRIVRGVVDALLVGGALLTGHSESINAARFGLKQCAPSIYRKV